MGRQSRRAKEQRNVVHFGDENFHIDETDDLLEVYDKASFKEVFRACCVHSSHEWLWVAFAVSVLVFSLYWMLFGLNLLGESSKVMTGCAAGELFGSKNNPLT